MVKRSLLGKALPALKIIGNLGLLRARKLEVVAEHVIVAQLELGHVVLFLLFAQKILKTSFAVLHKIEQFVEGGIVALTEQAAFGDLWRQIVAQGLGEQIGDVFEHVPFLQQALKRRGQEHAAAVVVGGESPVQGAPAPHAPQAGSSNSRAEPQDRAAGSG